MNALFGNLIAENWNGMVRYDFSDLMRGEVPRLVEDIDLFDAKTPIAPSLAADFEVLTTPFGASVFDDSAFTKDMFYASELQVPSAVDQVTLLGATSMLTETDFSDVKRSTLPVEATDDVTEAAQFETVFEATNIELDAMMLELLEASSAAQAKAAPFEQIWDIDPFSGAFTELLEDPNSDLA